MRHTFLITGFIILALMVSPAFAQSGGHVDKLPPDIQNMVDTLLDGDDQSSVSDMIKETSERMEAEARETAGAEKEHSRKKHTATSSGSTISPSGKKYLKKELTPEELVPPLFPSFHK